VRGALVGVADDDLEVCHTRRNWTRRQKGIETAGGGFPRLAEPGRAQDISQTGPPRVITTGSLNR